MLSCITFDFTGNSKPDFQQNDELIQHMKLDAWRQLVLFSTYKDLLYSFIKGIYYEQNCKFDSG